MQEKYFWFSITIRNYDSALIYGDFIKCTLQTLESRIIVVTLGTKLYRDVVDFNFI